ncbi:MAG: rod shape-determining protein MreD [Legionellales bacterium]
MLRSSQHSPPYWIIGLTLIGSLLLMIVPLPEWLQDYRPNWLMLFLIYWAMMTPERVGIGTAWICGLLLDGLQGTLLGENALLCALVVFVTTQFHQRLRMFPILQQCVFIFLLLGIQFIILVWIQGISGQPIQGWYYGLPVIISAWIWPLIYSVLHWVQTRFKS